MRISDWSSDVCSSDLCFLLDPYPDSLKCVSEAQRKVVTIAQRVVRAPAGEDGVVDARRQRFGDVDRGAEIILLSSFDDVLDRIRRRAVDVPLHAELWPEGPAKDHIVVFADDDGAITPCELVGKTAGLPVRIQGREIIGPLLVLADAVMRAIRIAGFQLQPGKIWQVVDQIGRAHV